MQAILARLAKLDHTQPILAACKSFGMFISGVLRAMAYDSARPASSCCMLQSLSPVHDLRCQGLILVIGIAAFMAGS